MEHRNRPYHLSSEVIPPGVATDARMMDHTAIPAGIRIEGVVWTGQPTTFTALCPRCGLVRIASALQNNERIIVHRGRAGGGILEGVNYCKFIASVPRARSQ